MALTVEPAAPLRRIKIKVDGFTFTHLIEREATTDECSVEYEAGYLRRVRGAEGPILCPCGLFEVVEWQ